MASCREAVPVGSRTTLPVFLRDRACRPEFLRYPIGCGSPVKREQVYVVRHAELHHSALRLP